MSWIVTPAANLERRPPERAVSPPRSHYVAMRDGCRIALDVYLPQGDGPFPTIALFTPYYRRFKLRNGAHGEQSPSLGKFRDLFVPRGYAVVMIDVRGTGASFGTRDSFRSPREREDSGEIAAWIVAQPWSNGRIGATGISYGGAASDFLASTGHPAVKAIAPLFAVWDTYADNYFPGGIQLKSLTQTYDELMVGLGPLVCTTLGGHADAKVLRLALRCLARALTMTSPVPKSQSEAGSGIEAALKVKLS